jgi:SAM-dependent methyltransferase
MTDLRTLEGSALFYEQRYVSGYMEEWPEDKKLRVLELIKKLDLPESGSVLDFGCGNGVFTEVLRRALPKWRIHGCEISQEAIANAKRRLPGATFFLSNDPAFAGRTFDFVFSHHVLEHVFDIESVGAQIAERCAEHSAMLHIMPCGNEGSFEWKLCNWHRGGIDAGMGGRFFFEDPGHIRRLNTVQCQELFSKSRFRLAQEYYSNQRIGAMNWMTRSNPRLIIKMFNPLNAKDLPSALRLAGLFLVFAPASMLRAPLLIEKRLARNRLSALAVYLPARLAALFERVIVAKASDEWELKRHDRAGSEMYLFFQR